MTETIEGDWRMLIEDEPIEPGNRIVTLRDSRVLDADGVEACTYTEADGGTYRVTLGQTLYSVRAIGTGTVETLSGSVDYGDWSDPVVFSRVRYDIRPPYGTSGD